MVAKVNGKEGEYGRKPKKCERTLRPKRNASRNFVTVDESEGKQRQTIVEALKRILVNVR